jgi:DNA-binding CsgD family transcriptional regulator
LDRDDLDKHINLIYETVTEPARWHKCLESIANSINAKSAVIGVDDLQSNLLITGTRFGFSEDMLEEYQKFQGKDLWVETLKEVGSQNFLLSHELVPQNDFIASEFFNCLARQLDVYHTTGLHLNKADNTALRIAFQRGKCQGYYGKEEKNYLNRLLPHIKHALSLSKKLLDTQLSEALTEGVFEQLEYGVLLVDSSGAVVRKNNIIEKILSTGQLFKVQHNRLRSVQGIRDGDLNCAIVSVCQTERLENLDPTFPFLISKQNDGVEQVCLIEITRFQVSGNRSAFQFTGMQPEPLALLSIRDLSKSSKTLDKRLKSLYKLSASEIDIAVELSKGLSPKEIAEKRCRSIETIRTQIKQVIIKMGAKRSSDLVSLVNKISF